MKKVPEYLKFCCRVQQYFYFALYYISFWDILLHKLNSYADQDSQTSLKIVKYLNQWFPNVLKFQMSC